MFPPQEIGFLKTGSQQSRDSFNAHRRTNPAYVLFSCVSVCVCLLHREKMPFHHVRAGLLYPDNYLSSSLTEGSEAFQLTSISTEELGGEHFGGAGRHRGGGGGHRQGEVWGISDLCFTARTMWLCHSGPLGESFSSQRFCRPFSEFHWFPITALRKWNQSQDSSVAGEKANRRRMRHW